MMQELANKKLARWPEQKSPLLATGVYLEEAQHFKELL